MVCGTRAESLLKSQTAQLYKHPRMGPEEGMCHPTGVPQQDHLSPLLGAELSQCLEGEAQLCSMQLLPPFLPRECQGCLLLCQEQVTPHPSPPLPPALLAWPCSPPTESSSLEETSKITRSSHQRGPTKVTPKPHPCVPHSGGS